MRERKIDAWEGWPAASDAVVNTHHIPHLNRRRPLEPTLIFT